VDQLVMVQVQSIEDMGAYVKLVRNIRPGASTD
jgi:translation initiation factor 2 alpha subunit (eIF-2alpha)